MDERITVDVREACRLLGCSPKFFYEHILTRPGFPLIRIGRKNLIPVAELRQWISEQRGA